LPPALADYLRGRDLAAITQETGVGTALVVVAPDRELAGMAGDVPIAIAHELYRQPTAPVIRLLTAFHDRPGEPLRFETFVNVADPQQRRESAGLASQAELPILLYDQGLVLRHGKRVRIPDGAEIAAVLAAADRLRERIAADRLDFDRAKQGVIAATDFPEFPYR
jgi:hypothetical protein